MKLNDLKRKHNSLLKKGQDLYQQMMSIYEIMVELQECIKKTEGDSYDPRLLFFGGGFYIHENDEDIEAVE